MVRVNLEDETAALRRLPLPSQRRLLSPGRRLDDARFLHTDLSIASPTASETRERAEARP